MEVKKWNYGNDKTGKCQAVQVGKLTLYFSYDTIVGFHDYENGLVISENVWSRSTGKHLNWINSKQEKTDYKEFRAKLKETLSRYKLIKEG